MRDSLYAQPATIKDTKYVLNNLCEDTITELRLIFGDSYKEQTFGEIKSTSYIYSIKRKPSGEPVGVYGLLEQSKNSAGIFLLTTDNLHKGNIITFLKGAKKQVSDWMNDYELIMDNCYKKNLTIQKWLRLLGFKPSKFQDDNFQIYYKGNINLWKI